MEMRNAHRVLDGRPEARRPLGGLCHVMYGRIILELTLGKCVVKLRIGCIWLRI
jgi:hypothetical protein